MIALTVAISLLTAAMTVGAAAWAQGHRPGGRGFAVDRDLNQPGMARGGRGSATKWQGPDVDAAKKSQRPPKVIEGIGVKY